jgi:4-aminobutyrate aminotransferase
MKPGVAVESIAWRALDKGVNLSASEGRDLSMTAPLVIGEDELDRALDVVEQAVAEEATAAYAPSAHRMNGKH